MTFKELEDSLIVQARLLDRVDRKLEDLADYATGQQKRIDGLLQIVESHEARLGTMQAAMTSLFEHIERFIQGLESDGHK